MDRVGGDVDNRAAEDKLAEDVDDEVGNIATGPDVIELFVIAGTVISVEIKDLRTALDEDGQLLVLHEIC